MGVMRRTSDAAGFGVSTDEDLFARMPKWNDSANVPRQTITTGPIPAYEPNGPVSYGPSPWSPEYMQQQHEFRGPRPQQLPTMRGQDRDRQQRRPRNDDDVPHYTTKSPYVAYDNDDFDRLRPTGPPPRIRKHRRWPLLVLVVMMLLGGTAVGAATTLSPSERSSYLESAREKLPRSVHGKLDPYIPALRVTPTAVENVQIIAPTTTTTFAPTTTTVTTAKPATTTVVAKKATTTAAAKKTAATPAP